MVVKFAVEFRSDCGDKIVPIRGAAKQKMREVDKRIYTGSARTAIEKSRGEQWTDSKAYVKGRI